MLNPYNLIPNDKGYHFYTDENLSYFVYFDQGTNYFSLTPNLNPLVYGFGFECSHSVDDHVYDERIEDTIITIFIDFFKHNPTGILTYICDAQDNYEVLRFRLFNFWFYRHLVDKCERLKIRVPSMNIYGAMIFLSDSPISPYIKEAFFKEAD